jgi:hypothetical protein
MNTTEIKLTKIETSVLDAYNNGMTNAWSIARSLSKPGTKITAPRENQIRSILDDLAQRGVIA